MDPEWAVFPQKTPLPIRANDSGDEGSAIEKGHAREKRLHVPQWRDADEKTKCSLRIRVQ